MGNAQPTLYFGKDDQPCFTPEDIAKRASLLKAEKLIGSAKEIELLAEVTKRISKTDLAENLELVKFIALASLRFRKYDFESALERTNNYLQWRRKLFGNLRPQEEHESFAKTKRMLQLNFIAVLPDLAPQGQALLCVKLRNLRPDLFDASDVAKFVHFIFCRVLRRSPRTQVYGIVDLVDMHGAGRNNFDAKVPQEVLKVIRKNLPLRVGGLLMCRPNALVRIIVPILKMFMPTKLAARLRVVSELASLTTEFGIPKASLPPYLGGSLPAGADETFVRALITEASAASSVEGDEADKEDDSESVPPLVSGDEMSAGTTE